MKRRVVSFAALMVLCSSAFAQEGPPLEVWIEAGLSKNPRSAISRAAVLTAEADRLRASASLLPTLTVQGAYTRNQFATVVQLPSFTGAEPEEIVISP